MKKRGFILIIIASIAWGTSGIFVHFLAPYGFSSVQMSFFRTSVSILVMGGYALVFNRNAFKIKLRELLLYIGSGLSCFGTQACYFYCMQATSVSTAVVLMYLAPVIVLVYSVLFLGEKLTRLKGSAIVTMLIGCGLVSGIIGGLKFDALGIAIGFASGISYGIYNIFTKIQMQSGCNPVSATLYTFIFACASSLFVCHPETIPGLIAANIPVTLALIIGMGLCTCVLPYVTYTLGMKELPAGTASSLGIVEPMAATIFSVILFNEQLTIFPVLGIILILGSVILLGKSENV